MFNIFQTQTFDKISSEKCIFIEQETENLLYFSNINRQPMLTPVLPQGLGAALWMWCVISGTCLASGSRIPVAEAE